MATKNTSKKKTRRAPKGWHFHKNGGIVIKVHRDTITASYDDQMVSVGCQFHHIDHWLKEYDNIGKTYGYNKSDRIAYGKLLLIVKAVLCNWDVYEKNVKRVKTAKKKETK